MAVDSEDKRKSASNTGVPGLDGLPLPDGTIDSADMADLSGMYGGIPAAIEPAPVGDRVTMTGSIVSSSNRVPGADSSRVVDIYINTGVGVAYDFEETETS